MKYFKTTEQATVDSYPYGRLRTQAIFGLDWKRGKGFRSTFQTVNPKTGRLNAVKVSTYSPLLIMKQDETGFTNYTGASMYDEEAKKNFFNLLSIHHDLFTPEQIEDLALYAITMLKVDFKASLIYSIRPEHHEEAIKVLKEVYSKPVNILAEIAKTRQNLWSQVIIDFDRINSLKDKDYNPFKIVASEPVSIMDMIKSNHPENNNNN